MFRLVVILRNHFEIIVSIEYNLKTKKQKNKKT